MQVDLRVNNTLIKDQFLWVSFIITNFQPIMYMVMSILCFWFVNCIYLGQQKLICDRSQDLNNFESDPEEFARTFCKDLSIDDPEVGVSLLTLIFLFMKKKTSIVVCSSLSLVLGKKKKSFFGSK